MELLPIYEKLEDNKTFQEHPLTREWLPMTLEFFQKVGYQPPWIGYYAALDGELVGNAAFKGAPVNHTVEIAYGTFEHFQNKGIATQMCRLLVEKSLATDPTIRITARTLPNPNFSTRVLEKNGFVYVGIINDPEDGDVWEWEYRG